MLQLISLLVENKPGALMRVTGVLAARGYNIESLTVARTLDAELSRMSIVVDIDSTQRAQVIKQINKLVNVLQVSDLTEGSAVRRELVLLWIGTTQENRMSVLKEAELVRASGPGRLSAYQLTPAPLLEIEQWARTLATTWANGPLPRDDSSGVDVPRDRATTTQEP